MRPVPPSRDVIFTISRQRSWHTLTPTPHKNTCVSSLQSECALTHNALQATPTSPAPALGSSDPARAQRPLADRRGATPPQQKLRLGRASNPTLRAHMRTLSLSHSRGSLVPVPAAHPSATRARAEEAPDSTSTLRHKAHAVPAWSVRPTVVVCLLRQPSPSLPSPAVWIGNWPAEMSRLCGAPKSRLLGLRRVCTRVRQ